MKTDRFMQGILVDDDDELFSYSRRPQNHTVDSVLKKIKRNLKNLKYHTFDWMPAKKNNQAVFSKSNTPGNMNQVIADIRQRLRQKDDS